MPNEESSPEEDLQSMLDDECAKEYTQHPSVLFKEVMLLGAKEILSNENNLCFIECKQVGYINPFKSASFGNPAVDIETSRLRTQSKLISKRSEELYPVDYSDKSFEEA